MLQAYGDGTLFGEKYGEGPVRVVFLHGWDRSGKDFAACATELAGMDVASVALDLPGFGASPLPLIPGGARLYGELLVPALEELSSGPLVVVGHSFGGRIAAVLGAYHPTLVRGLVLTGAPLVRAITTVKSPLRYRVVRSLYAKGMVREKRMERARHRYGSADYRNCEGLLRSILVATVNESYEKELARITVPVSLVWGDDDRAVPMQTAARAAALLNCPHTFRSVAFIGHFLPVQSPHELVVSILELLA
jgi:pimeloyl-ACP methyl ester carboxylesterase